VCPRTGRDEQVEIPEPGGSKAALSGAGRRRDGVDGLAGPVLSRARQPAGDRVPELGDSLLLADQHPGPGAHGHVAVDAAAATRRNDVRTGVAERDQTAILRHCREPTETAARDILEEHALDRILRAVGENLLEGWIDDVRHAPDLHV
jgi:hypothetical protein